MLLHTVPDRLAGRMMALLRGADEIVIRDVESRKHIAEALGVTIGELDRRNALGIGRLQHLDAVLIGT
jgi:hypothetical protein